MKKDHGNEFRGSKNWGGGGGGGGGKVWVGLEWPENGEIRRPKVTATAEFAGPIWARPIVVRREIPRPSSPSGGASTWVARASRGWPETSPTAKTQLA